MNKTFFSKLTLLLTLICAMQPKQTQANDTLDLIAGTVMVAGATYVGYRAWNFYRAYSQKRTFENAKQLLKQVLKIFMKTI